MINCQLHEFDREYDKKTNHALLATKQFPGVYFKFPMRLKSKDASQCYAASYMQCLVIYNRNEVGISSNHMTI